jgi:archaellin
MDIEIHDRPVLFDRIQVNVTPDYMIAQKVQSDNNLKTAMIDYAKIKRYHNSKFSNRDKFNYWIYLDDEKELTDKYPFISTIRISAIPPFSVQYKFNFIRYIKYQLMSSNAIRKEYDSTTLLDSDNFLNYEVWPYWDNDLIARSINNLESIMLEIANDVMRSLVSYGVTFEYQKVTVNALEVNIDYFVGCNMSLTFMSKIIDYMFTDDGREFR